VTGVSISVEGSPLQLPGVPNVQTEETWEQYDPNGITDSAVALIVRRGAIREIVGRRSIAGSGPLGRGRLQLSDPALSLDSSLVVALASDRSRVVAQDLSVATTVDPVLSGTNFAAPSIDGSGAVWLADRDATGTHISWKPPDGAIESVAAPALRGLHVVAMRAALDGTRVALVVKGRDGEGHLLLARVVQRSAGLRLQALRPLEERLTNVRDVTWSSASSLVALARDRGSVLQPFQIGIDGSVSPVAGTTLQGIDGLSTAPGADLLASTSDGGIYKNKGVRWRALVPGRDPAYPG
ncbi:MAG: LpqB family beta-propeller domain-containing protein, partial [Candidatus Nanopelagicales bacterium]